MPAKAKKGLTLSPKIPAEGRILCDPKDVSVSIEVFVALVNQGVEAWTRAGMVLVSLLEADPEIMGKIHRAHPSVSYEMLRVFERIGRKQIYAPLLADGSLAARRLLDCPYSVQEKYYGREVDVVVSVRGLEIRTVKKSLHEMTRSEIKMVFGPDNVRSPPEQAELFDTHKSGHHVGAKFSIPFAPEKPVTVGYFTVTIGVDGVPELAPCPPSERAQDVRVGPVEAVRKGAIIHVFYRVKAT